jgi:multiple sugar transport system substrate-binding protein
MAAQPDVYRFACQPQMYQAFGVFKAEADAMYQKFLTDQISADEMLKWLDDFWTTALAEEGQLW